LFDPRKHAALQSLIENVAFVKAVNDAWGLVALITLAAFFPLPWTHRMPDSERGGLHQ
jgi:hypothetical protein